MEKERTFFVIDMKSFFASCECAERGLDPMTTNLVVADPTRTEKTICLAVTPAMKALGVKNRCRLFEIPKNIDYIIAPPRMRKYIEYASNIYAIYLKYISKDDIHVYSIDECFIDATDYLKIYKLSAKDFAKKLMGEILDSLKIYSSCGIGTNMYLAKIALDITAKNAPDRIGFLNKDLFIKTLWNHKPLNDFWGISYGTIERLNKLGINDMEGIAKANPDYLYKVFGINAELLIDHANGEESCLISDIKKYKSKSKSISSSQILPFNYTFEQGLIVLKEMIQNGCYDLAKYGYSTDLIGIIIVCGDKNKTVLKGNVRMKQTTNVYSIISAYAIDLYNKICAEKLPVRRIGYNFGSLVGESEEQYDFFTDIKKVKKEKEVVSSVIKVKNKFGANSLIKAIDLQDKATQIERNATIGGHKSGD